MIMRQSCPTGIAAISMLFAYSIVVSAFVIDKSPLVTNANDMSQAQHICSNNRCKSLTIGATTSDVLSLDSIRASLIRQEETIIFALIERAQFLQNKVVYEKKGFGDLRGDDNEDDLSLLEYMLIGTERLHAKVRRYTSPEEHAFFPEKLPPGCTLEGMRTLDYPELLSPIGDADKINFNSVLFSTYLNQIVSSIAREGDDEQHGSTVNCDVAVLQALSKRIHYGKFVAESKYLSDPEEYQRLVDANDADGVMELLTNIAVEEKVLRRARLKAATYGREPLLSHMPPIEGTDETSEIVAAAAASAVVAAVEAMNCEVAKKKGKVDPNIIESIYRDFVIPLTKDVEVAYLYRRCGRDPPKNICDSFLISKYAELFTESSVV